MPKAFGPSRRAPPLQGHRGHWPSAQESSKGLELSSAKGSRSTKERSPVWACKPDSVSHHCMPLHTTQRCTCTRNTASTPSHLLFRIDTSWWKYCSHLSSYPAMAERRLAITSIIKIFPRIIAESIIEGYFSNLN